MFNQWALALQIPLLFLVIPAALIIGHRMRGGPLLVIGGGALLGFAAFWLIGAQVTPGIFIRSTMRSYIFFGSVTLLLGAWSLALEQSLRARRWVWVAPLCLAVYLTFVSLFAILITPLSFCLFSSQQPYCSTVGAGVWTALISGSFIGPGAIMLYALRPYIARRDAPPAGLHTSRLGAPDVAEPDTVTEPQ